MISILSLLYNIMKIVNTYLRFMADGFSSFLGADCCCWQGTALFDLLKVLECVELEWQEEGQLTSLNASGSASSCGKSSSPSALFIWHKIHWYNSLSLGPANQCSSSTALHCEVCSSRIQSITRIVHTHTQPHATSW